MSPQTTEERIIANRSRSWVLCFFNGVFFKSTFYFTERKVLTHADIFTAQEFVGMQGAQLISANYLESSNMLE